LPGVLDLDPYNVQLTDSEARDRAELEAAKTQRQPAELEIALDQIGLDQPFALRRPPAPDERDAQRTPRQHGGQLGAERDTRQHRVTDGAAEQRAQVCGLTLAVVLRRVKRRGFGRRRRRGWRGRRRRCLSRLGHPQSEHDDRGIDHGLAALAAQCSCDRRLIRARGQHDLGLVLQRRLGRAHPHLNALQGIRRI
jgi:hypothetical protein